MCIRVLHGIQNGIPHRIDRMFSAENCGRVVSMVRTEYQMRTHFLFFLFVEINVSIDLHNFDEKENRLDFFPFSILAVAFC